MGKRDLSFKERQYALTANQNVPIKSDWSTLIDYTSESSNVSWSTLLKVDVDIGKRKTDKINIVAKLRPALKTLKHHFLRKTCENWYNPS